MQQVVLFCLSVCLVLFLFFGFGLELVPGRPSLSPQGMLSYYKYTR